MILKPGDRLWASCPAQVFGVVTGVHPEHGTVDIEVFEPEELETVEEDELGNDLGSVPWEGPRNDQGHALVAGVPLTWEQFDAGGVGYPWPDSTGWRVVLETPGDGCYRCTKLFSVWTPVDTRPTKS